MSIGNGKWRQFATERRKAVLKKITLKGSVAKKDSAKVGELFQWRVILP
jgi:hypothetical protein